MIYILRIFANGDVYIFLSRDFTRLRVYYFHHKGEILTEKILHNNRYVTPVFEDTEKNDYLYGMLKSEEQQRSDLAVTAYGQHTESGKYHHGSQPGHGEIVERYR